MAAQVKWGVIGSGGIARRRTIPEGLVPAVNAELVAVYDVNATANREVAEATGSRAVESLAALLESEAEAIYIATPASLHVEQALACAGAGKHVLCEKPLGLTVAEAESMVAAFGNAGVRLGTAFMMRFMAQHREALDMVAQGRLGTLTYGRAQLSCWYPPMDGAWRQVPACGGGGSLMDMGGHCIDLLEMFFGPVRKVACFTNSLIHDYESEDSAVAMLTFESGAIGTVDAFFCIPDASSKNVLEIYGSRGSILASGTVGQGDAGEMVAFLEEADAGYDAQQARVAEPGGLTIAPPPVNTYRAEVEEFSAALLEGRPHSNSAELGLQSQRVLAACYESARTCEAVCVTPPTSCCSRTCR